MGNLIDAEVVEVFEKFTDEYDGWFDQYPAVFQSEMAALKKLIPTSGNGIEIGVGTGRFASALGIKKGVEQNARRGQTRIWRRWIYRSIYQYHHKVSIS